MSVLDKLAALEKRATKAPWTAFVKLNTRTVAVQAEGTNCDIVGWMGFDDSFRPTKEHAANAELIAALRNHAPALLAVAAAARDEELERMSECPDPQEVTRLRTLKCAALAALEKEAP